MRSLRLLPATLLLLLCASAAHAGPDVVYVTTTDGQVLKIDTSVSGYGDIEVLVDTELTLGDVVFGPDGKLYVAAGDQIIRVDPSPTYVWSYDTVGYIEGAVFRGVAFNGGPDLYATTDGHGVRKFANVVNSPLPVASTEAFPTEPGAGLAFDIPGDLAIVTVDRVALAPWNLSNFKFGAVADISNTIGLSGPLGAAVNTCGDLLVTAGTEIKRYPFTLGSPAVGQFGAASPDPFVDFDSEYPQYLEVDASNTVWVVTNDTYGGSTLWRLDPGTADPVLQITSCTGDTPTPVASISGGEGFSAAGPGRHVAAYEESPSGEFVGVALPPTSHTITLDFTPPGEGPGVSSAKAHFGHFTFNLDFKEILLPFSLEITATRSLPSQVNFSTSVFDSSTHGMPFASLGGQVVQFIIEPGEGPVPLPGTHFSAGTSTSPGVLNSIGYFPHEQPLNVGMAREPDDGLTAPYGFDISLYHWEIGILDAGDGSTADAFSKRVIYNAALKEDGEIENFRGGSVRFGAPITWRFVVEGDDNRRLRSCDYRLSMVKITGAGAIPQIVVSTGAQTGNMFSQGPTFTFVQDTSILDGPGKYLATVTGDCSPPISKQIRIRGRRDD